MASPIWVRRTCSRHNHPTRHRTLAGGRSRLIRVPADRLARIGDTLPTVGTFDDLLRERRQREVADYRRLQRVAAERVFTRTYGRQAASVAEIEAAFPSGSIATIDPSRHLAPDEVTRILATATGAGCKPVPS